MPGDSMLRTAQRLNFYKRTDIQEEICREAHNKEIAVKFGDKGFGKRPDVLVYPNDVMDFVQKGATSFHASEELWANPLNIVTGAKRSEMDELRTGWDLVIDIDCPYWKLSKITAWLIIEALRQSGISSLSIKFSGNKGFHIGVPFEVFPEELDGVETRTQFPEDARHVAGFLLQYIKDSLIDVTREQDIIFNGKFKIRLSKLIELTGKDFRELTRKECMECGTPFEEVQVGCVEYVCRSCGEVERMKYEDGMADYIECKTCNNIMTISDIPNHKCGCGSTYFMTRFNPLAIIDVDTILISSRHLYRMCYSMHEKSGLVSVPFNPDEVLGFRKEFAKPENVTVGEYRFLDRMKVRPNEGTQLLIQAREYAARMADIKDKNIVRRAAEVDVPNDAIPAELFPPCIHNILKGLEDGRKRGMFILINFLNSVGWKPEQIEVLFNEWNKKNPEALRETIVKTQLRYNRQNRRIMLPPNCDNKMYYHDLGICKPDEFCSRIKNPAQYAKRKSDMQPKKKKRKKKAKKADVSENSKKSKKI